MSIFLRKYGASATIDGVVLIEKSTGDFKSSPTLATGDVKISKDGGAFSNLTTLPTVTPSSGTSVQISLSATEMQAARIAVRFVDQTANKEWEDQEVIIETFGNASAQHQIDLSDSVRMGLTALPNAAAEASGGLFTRGTGAGQIAQTSNGTIDVNNVNTIGGLTTGPLAISSATNNTITVSDLASQVATNSFVGGVTYIISADTTINGQTAIITAIDRTTGTITVYCPANSGNWSVNPTSSDYVSIIIGAPPRLAATTHTGATIPTVTDVTNDVGITQTGADKVWDTTSRTITDGTIGTVNDKTGYSLSSSGLDQILIETGISASANLVNDSGTQLTAINARQFMALVASAMNAVVDGADGFTITFKPVANPSGPTRITATVDSYGNRSAVTLRVPD